MSISVGEKAPDFTMPTDGNGSVSLSKLRGKPVVLYFYPKDDTTGCTAEACGFRDTFPDYGKTGAVVIGVSRDPVAAHDKFKKKYQLPFTLASDQTGEVTERYGVCGRSPCICGRTCFFRPRRHSARSLRRSGPRPA